VRIRIIFSAQARTAAGCSETSLEFSAPLTVTQALELVAQKYGDALRRIVLDEFGTVQASVMLFVNDEQILNDNACELHDGDVLTVMPPISGG